MNDRLKQKGRARDKELHAARDKRLHVARDMGAGVLVRAWTQITAFIVVIVAARTLERQEFGIYAIASVFVIVLSTIMYSGIYEYIIKTEDFTATADTCFWINFALAALGAIVIAILAPLTAALVHAPKITLLMLSLAPSSLIAALTSWQEALLLRRKKITAYYIVWFFSETAAAAIAITLFFTGARIYSLVGYRYGQIIVSSVGYSLYQRDFPGLTWRTSQARLALDFASGLYGSRIIGIITNYSADLIIGTFVGPAAAGSYRLASRMVFGFSEIWFQPIKTIAWVRFSSAVRAGVGLDQEWLGLMTALSMVAWPTLGTAAILSRPLIHTILGTTWLAAAPIFAIFALSKSGELFEVFLDPILATAGDTRKLLHIRIAAAFIAVAGFLLLARFGPVHAAWAQAATYLTLAAITIKTGFKCTGARPRDLVTTLLPGIVTTLFTMLAAAAAARVASFTHLAPVAQFAIAAAASTIVWAVMAGLIFRRRVLSAILKLREQSSQTETVGSAAQPVLGAET